jgi:hypothetical protein
MLVRATGSGQFSFSSAVADYLPAEFNPDRGSGYRSAHDLSPCYRGARRFGGGDHRPCPGPCRSADEVFNQHPQRQAGLCALRFTQRRRQLPARAALSSTARAVPERCGGLVWRRPRPCESHARESYEPDRSYEPREPNESCDPDDSYGPDESDESYNPDESCEPEQ